MFTRRLGLTLGSQISLEAGRVINRSGEILSGSIFFYLCLEVYYNFENHLSIVIFDSGGHGECVGYAFYAPESMCDERLEVDGDAGTGTQATHLDGSIFVIVGVSE